MRPEEIRELVSDCDFTLGSIEDVLEDASLTAAQKVAELEDIFYGGDDDSDENSD